MSEVKVNKISPRTNCGTVTLGDSGDSFVIPSGATITNNGTQTGFGREGSVNWQTSSIKTATFTATSGEGYFCNTSGGAFTVNLPAGSAGAIVSVADYTRTFSDNNLTIAANGSELIGGQSGDALLNVNGQSATFVYVDGTEGWINVQETETSQTGSPPFIQATGGTITTCGDYKIHTFTGPGTFTVCAVAGVCSATRNLVSHLVVAGGGGGGSSYRSGGGGAGGYREVVSPGAPYTGSPLNGYPTPGNRVTVTAQAYPIQVGGGGAGGGACTACSGINGTPSIFSTITSAGGGAGGEYNPSSGPASIGSPGGSGGGGGGDNSGPSAKGTGNTPPTTPAQGNNGGDGCVSTNSSGGGGGGAGAAGTPGGSPATSNVGGIGTPTNIAPASGTTGPAPGRYFAGGGGGGQYVTVGGANPAGGAGGGGAGGTENSPGNYGGGTNGTANTGGGGGGKAGTASANTSGTGGSGIVVIRYKYQ
jgi:hypothetical protein